MAVVTAFDKVSNNAVTTLLAGITDSELTVTVGSDVLFPVAPFFISIQNEILSVTARPSSNTFTVTRAAQSTSAAAHVLGVAVELRVTAGSVTAIHTAINTVENKVPYEIFIPFGSKDQTLGSGS